MVTLENLGKEKATGELGKTGLQKAGEPSHF
jgi:hypothetical protein